MQLAAVWFVVAAALMVLVMATTPNHFKVSLVITVISGMIAMLSLAPGVIGEWSGQTDAKTNSDSYVRQNYLGPLFGGIVLRLVATVALFVLCRYQMADSIHWIASLTIGWYVVLTTTEVVLLVRKLPTTDRLRIHSTTVAPGQA